MRLPRGTALHMIFFLVGILLPTLVLSVFSFRSIRNEVLLAEKNYEEEQTSFRKILLETVQKETVQILQEVRRRSQYLFDRPQSVDEFFKPYPLDKIEGVGAVFLFDGGRPIYPNTQLGRHQSELPTVAPTEGEKLLYRNELGQESKASSARTEVPISAVLLRQLRYQYQTRNFNAAMKTLAMLERLPKAQGYLSGNLTESLWLMRFDILVESGQHHEAEIYCLDLLDAFLSHRIEPDLDQMRFVLETMLNSILSFEKLDNTSRERFWNLRNNLEYQLDHARLYNEHRNFLQRVVLDGNEALTQGLDFHQNDNQWFFVLSHPWLPGNQVVVGIIDTVAFSARIHQRLQTLAREWKQIRYTITDANDSIVEGKPPQGEPRIIARLPIAEQYPQWTLTLYQKDNGEFRSESRNKMVLLYSLVGFSLIIIVLGSIFVFQGLSQERRLLAMKANFLSSVSHELKTPLTSIKMFAEMIAGGRVQKQEKIMEYSGLIGKEATRLENLIGAILSYTRMEHGTAAYKWECLDLSALTEKVCGNLDGIAQGKGLELHTRFDDECWVMGDYTSLYSLVQNLSDNAIKYTPPPGTVKVHVERQDDFVYFIVSDSGVGIPPSEHKNIFKDFYRVGDEMTRSSKGSGLGLAIVKRVVEAHRASIEVHSRPGKGSTFTVRFKRAEHAE